MNRNGTYNMKVFVLVILFTALASLHEANASNAKDDAIEISLSLSARIDGRGTAEMSQTIELNEELIVAPGGMIQLHLPDAKELELYAGIYRLISKTDPVNGISYLILVSDGPESNESDLSKSIQATEIVFNSPIAPSDKIVDSLSTPGVQSALPTEMISGSLRNQLQSELEPKHRAAFLLGKSTTNGFVSNEKLVDLDYKLVNLNDKGMPRFADNTPNPALQLIQQQLVQQQIIQQQLLHPAQLTEISGPPHSSGAPGHICCVGSDYHLP